MMGLSLHVHAIMGRVSGSSWKTLSSLATGSPKLTPILKGLEKAGTEDEESWTLGNRESGIQGPIKRSGPSLFGLDG